MGALKIEGLAAKIEGNDPKKLREMIQVDECYVVVFFLRWVVQTPATRRLVYYIVSSKIDLKMKLLGHFGGNMCCFNGATERITVDELIDGSVRFKLRRSCIPWAHYEMEAFSMCLQDFFGVPSKTPEYSRGISCTGA